MTSPNPTASKSAPLAPITRRDHLFALVWLAVLCGCVLFCVRDIALTKPFHSNLLELLPRDERNPVVHDLSVKMASRFDDKLVVLVKGANRQESLAYARDLQARLLAAPGLQADDTGERLPQLLVQQYRPYSQQLLTPERRRWLESHSPAELAEERYRELFSPVNLPYPHGFKDDPFNLGGYWLAGLAAQFNLQDYQGFPLIEPAVSERADSVRDAWLVVTAQLTSSPFDVGMQQQVSDALAGFRSAQPKAEILTSGMIFHATAGTRQAKQEINTVGLGSGIGIVFLVLLVFRSLTPLFAVFLTMTSAYVLALTVSLLVFDRIHLITLAFGSTLLGVVGDYVLHFLMGSQREGSGSRARHTLRYAMAIGALTGMGAYLLQYATPFPGLQQMAVFCAAGIAGAWFTVLALAPYYRINPMKTNAPLRAAGYFYRLGIAAYRPLWNRPVWVGAGLVLLVALASASLLRGGVNDAVINLNTSPMALMDSERRVQQLLQQPSPTRFFVVEGATPDAVLAQSQAVDAALARHPQVTRRVALHHYLPSLAQQESDRALVANKLYGEAGALALLCKKLGAPCAEPDMATPAMIAEDIHPELAQWLPPVLEQDGKYFSLVGLTTTASDEELAALAAPLAGVTLVNQTRDLSNLLGRYRASVSEILLITLVLLAAGLALRYRRQSWRMLVPLVIAMLVALGCAAVEGITLFHTMALLLVIGIGLDTAVFYTEVGFNEESWLASSLACSTSILAFGLLSLSAVPVLHQFGVIILCGILAAWLLTPLFFRPMSPASPMPPASSPLPHGSL